MSLRCDDPERQAQRARRRPVGRFERALLRMLGNTDDFRCAVAETLVLFAALAAIAIAAGVVSALTGS